MREILPNIFQIGAELFTAEQHLSYFIRGISSNVLAYPPLLHDETIQEMVDAGGLSRILLNRWEQVGSSIDRLHQIFGATTVLPRPRENLETLPFLWTDGLDYPGLRPGLQIVMARASGQYWYILNEAEGRMFFPGDSLYLFNGHWRVDPILPREDRRKLLEILETHSFEYIMPNRARGLISFQKLTPDIQAIETRYIRDVDLL